MTIGEIESQVRVIVNDAIEPYRFASVDVRRYVRDAVRDLNRIRPETRYMNGVLTDYTLDGEASTVIPIDVRFEEAIVDYAVYRVYQEDDSDTVNQQLGNTYLQRAEALMQM